MSTLSLESLTVSTEAIRYDALYRKHGIRRVGELSSPRYSLLDEFELPRNAVVHYLPESSVELGINPNHLFLKHGPNLVLVDHITQLSAKEGSPLKENVSESAILRKYRSQYRNLRPLKNLATATRDDKAVVVVNYGMLQHLFRYRKTFQSRQFAFTNLLETVVENINRIATQTQRDQYISLRLPKVLPERETFVRGAKGLNRTTLNSFGDDESLMLLQWWMLLGDEPNQSILGKLSDKAKASLNLVIQESGRFTLLNVGQWLSFKASEDNSGLSSTQMQVKFLQLLDSTFAIRSAGNQSRVETHTDENGNVVPVSIIDEGEEVEALQALNEKADKGELDDTQMQYTPIQETDDLVDVPDDGSPNPFAAGVSSAANYLLDQGTISAAEHRRYERLAKEPENITNPFGQGSLLDATKGTQAALEDIPVTQAPDSDFVSDKSLMQSSVTGITQHYIKNVLHADIASCVLAAQNAGVAINGYNVEKHSDANSNYEIHSVKFTPVGGASSTFRFRVPSVDDEGQFKVAGINYKMRFQRGDIPIRKVNQFKVALTSYYSKLFVARSQKKKDNYEGYLQAQLQLQVEQGDDIKKVDYGDAFSHHQKVPRSYGIVAKLYRSFVHADVVYLWDYKKVIDHFGEKVVSKAQADGEYPCGYGVKDNKMVMMSSTGVIYKPDTNEVYGTLEEVFGFDVSKVPNEVAEIDIMGKTIPIGILLAYYFGLNPLIRKLKATHKTIDRGSRLTLEDDEYVVRFANKSLVLNRQDKLSQLILAGLNSYKNTIGRYNLEDFDKRDVYGAIFEAEGLGVRYVREFDLMHQMYIDPITEQVLADMKEPTDFIPLLVRACQLLMDDHHPDEMAGSQLRLKGYERFSGHLYQEMVKGIRQYKAKPLTSKAKVDVHPSAVWNAIQQDPSVMIVEQSNPIHNLKEQENTTFGGSGGRSARTMVRRTRQFHKEDMGVISEATVDSGDVAVTTFLSPNAQIRNARGIIKGEVDINNTASMLSTSALVSPEALRDVSKRVGFISIQQSHVIAAKGYEVSPLRTGYESVIAHRTGKLFSYVAQGKGKIIRVLNDTLVVKYDDDTLGEQHIRIGRVYGTAAGKTIPHDLVCDLSEGQRVNKGDVLVYNSGFFERDIFNPTQVNWKIGKIARVALIEGNDTIEDSCSISPALAQDLEAPKTQVREIVLSADQNIVNLVNVGETLDADAILCNIQDPVNDTQGIDDQTAETLKLLARNSPRAKYKGVVAKIEVLYNAQPEDLSESLAQLVTQADKLRKKEAKRLNHNVTHGYVEDLNLDTVMLRIYIDGHVAMGSADKLVFANQLKSVVKHVMVGDNTTQDGQPVDALFGATSVDARVVMSPEVMGTTNVLLRLASKRMAQAYRK